MTTVWIARRALWRYGGLVSIIAASVGVETRGAEAHGLALFALLYLPCALAWAALDARRIRRKESGGVTWR